MLRILFIDDDPSIFQLMGDALREEMSVQPLTLLHAEQTPQELVRDARDMQPDVILLDGQLPGTSGPTVTALLHEQVPQVPVIGFSSSSSYRSAFMASGAADFVHKDPDDPQATARRVNAVVQRLLS